MKKNVLVISFYFPPYEGVGARRWAKFAKYLNRKGYNTWVLSANFEGISPWDKDIVDFEDKIHRVNFIPDKKPYFKRVLAKKLWEKLIWKVSYFLYRNKDLTNPINPFDVSSNSIVNFEKSALQIIEEQKIDLVIASGGPFHYLQCLNAIKSKTNCKIILDLRDPFPHRTEQAEKLTTIQLESELKEEQTIINSVDFVIAPCCKILEPFKNVFELPHGVDMEEYQIINPFPNEDNSSIKLTFGGHLYGVTKYFELLNDFSKALAKIVNLEVNCFVPGDIISKIDFESDSINFMPYKSTLDEFIFEQNSSNAQLYIFRAKHEDGCFTTKFFELVQTKKPILYFGPRNNVSRFIEENKLGFVIDENNIEETITKFLENNSSKLIPHDFNLEKHTVSYQTDRLIELIEGLYVE